VRRAEALERATALLARAGCPNGPDDARLLFRDVVGDVAASAATAEVRPATVEEFMTLVGRRAERRPLAHVRRRTQFRSLELAVDDRVFVPRTETELLVDAARSIPVGARVLEPCTGSGAVAVAVALERPDLHVTASDVSADAVEIARQNAHLHQARMEVVHADGIAAVSGGHFDAVICNPPYVAETESCTGVLPPELERHEPGQAFWGGPDGLDLHRRLIGELSESTIWVAFEVGDGQGATVSQLLAGRGLAVTSHRWAPGGSVRVVVAEW
jgi:release factor glutamine methyltransferase